MSDDLVVRLRSKQYRTFQDGVALCQEAADEIERLRTERDEARKIAERYRDSYLDEFYGEMLFKYKDNEQYKLPWTKQ